MKTLVWVEHDNVTLKDPTLPVVTAAAKLGEVHLLVAGKDCAAVADEAVRSRALARCISLTMTPMRMRLPRMLRR